MKKRPVFVSKTAAGVNRSRPQPSQPTIPANRLRSSIANPDREVYGPGKIPRQNET